jgi:hypothetical protein
MGGDKVKAVQTVSMKGGSGTRLRLQQTRHVGDPEEPAMLSNVIEIVDLAGGRASLDYQFNEGGFGQHRHEVLTSRGGKPVGVEYVDMRPVIATSPNGLFSWGTQTRRRSRSIATSSASCSRPARRPPTHPPTIATSTGRRRSTRR